MRPPVKRTADRIRVALVLSLVVAGLALGGGLTPAAPVPSTRAVAAATDPRPNIVLVSSDDQRLDEMRWMPITRKVIRGAGVNFVNGTSPHPQCCPARAMIQTGQFAQNNGVLSNSRFSGFHAFDPQHTIATWLQDAGYSTAFVGKYLNGYEAADGLMPGWDIFNPTVTNIYGFFDYTMLNNGSPRHFTDLHNADLVGRKTRDYIEDFAAEDKPFFVWASQTAPHSSRGGHGPIPAKRHRNVLEGVTSPASRAPSFDTNSPELPGPLLRPNPLRAHAKADHARHFTRRIQSLQAVDEQVGKIVDTLRATGELANTVFVFISDNGFLLGEHRFKGKNVAYDESVRVPFLMRGPGIPRDSTSEVPAGLVDLAPTFAQLAEADPDLTMDGVSLLPAARSGASLARDTMLVQGGADASNDVVEWLWRGVRTDRYTYARYVLTDEVILFDRVADPDELYNLAGSRQYRAVEQELASRLSALNDCVGDRCAVRFGPIPAPGESLR